MRNNILLKDSMILFFILAFISILTFEIFGFKSKQKHNKATFKSSLIRTVAYVGVSILYAFVVKSFHPEGNKAFYQYITGYLLELVLSFDNVFVFIVIFSSFAVPLAYQNRVLFYGIIGAILMRGPFIFGGSALVHKFEFFILVFALVLLFSGLKLLIESLKNEDEKKDISQNKLVKFLKKYLPLTQDYHGEKFFVKSKGLMQATPLFLVLCMIIVGDFIFAFDSIPAIFAVTRDPMLIYTSNMFAIIGLRSFFFVLEGIIEKFYYLKKALSLVLLLIGVKMTLNYFVHELIPIQASLVAVLVIMFGAIGLSILRNNKYSKKHEAKVH